MASPRWNRELSAARLTSSATGARTPRAPTHSLRHDEQRLPAAVEKAHKAEQEAGKQAVNGVGLEILPGGDHRRVVRENTPPAHP